MHERDFCQLYEAHYGHVLSYLRGHLPEESARDLTADTFLTAWKKLPEPPDHPVAWLLTVARHLRANAHRSHAREARLSDANAHQEPHDLGGNLLTLHVGLSNDPAQRSDRPGIGELEDRGVNTALARLRPSDREVLLLVAQQDLDSHGLAEVLGCSPGTARVRLHRARRRLLRLLDQPRAISPTSTHESTTEAAHGT